MLYFFRMSRISGCADPNTTSILVEGIPFTTIPKNNIVQDDFAGASWQQHQEQQQNLHSYQHIQGSVSSSSNVVGGGSHHPESSSNEVSSHPIESTVRA